MSVYNQAHDRDARGRLLRCYRRTYRPRTAPGWFVREFMNRPRRRANRSMCHRVLAGADADGLVWPPGSHRPQRYYW